MVTASAALIAASALAFAGDVPQRIEVPFRIADNAMIVDATVNGRNVSLMFDSGYSGSFVISPTVNVGKATGTINLRDFVGQFEAPTVPVTSLAFGGKKIDIVEKDIVQMNMQNMSLSYGQHCDGIMGLEVISPYVVEINFEKSKFIFHPRKELDITKRTPDGRRTFLAKMLPKGNNAIEMSVATSSGGKMTLSLDTGNAFYATTHRDVLERIGLWKEGTTPKYMGQSWVASGPVESWNLKMRDLSIYGVPVAESVWNIIDLPASSADGDGTVGFGFLRHFNIVLDMAQRRVWMENFSGKVHEAPMGSVGLYASHDKARGRMRVVYVSPESPAAKAGILPGDDLLGVDGKELSVLSFDQVNALLEGVPGSPVRLATSRGGSLMRHELTRALLINGL